MCGINAIINFRRRISNREIKAMNSCIKHRGPDDHGIYLHHSYDYSIALGHQRLSIIDLSKRGHQPMGIIQNKKTKLFYEDNKLSSADLVLNYNGEIYNYKDIRSELEKQGWKFESSSDTEVILKGFAEWRERLFNKLCGIFALIFFDRKGNKLYAVRDFPGIKPLYYLKEDETLYFSSELKYFYKEKQLTYLKEREVEYVQSKDITGESLFNEIQAIPIGHYLELDLKSKKQDLVDYYQLTSQIDKKIYLKKRLVIDELDALLNLVVKEQMVGDVEVGTICSGGIDSSLVTAIAKKYNPKVKIFSLDIKGDSEIIYARKVAEHLKLKLEEVLFDRIDLRKYLRKTVYHNDLPLIHPNTIAIMKLNQVIKKNNVTVILTGEGADELFGGYDKYTKLYRLTLLRKFTPKLPIWFFLQGDQNIWHLVNNEIHPKNLSELFLNRNNHKDIIQEIYNLYEELERNHIRAKINAFIVKDLFYYLNPLLRRADRTTMAYGVEGRVPYLDQRLIKFAINLPLKYKLDFFMGGKYILKKVAERYLPKEVVWRRKKGLPLPLSRWLNLKNEFDRKNFFLNEWKKMMDDEFRN